MRVIGVIPARYKSSRFPGKPLAEICGKPMIWWVYQQAKKVDSFYEVYVATDDCRIKKACESFDIKVVMTSEECATGSDRVAEVAKKIEGDVFINVQGDEPVIKPEMIQQLIDVFLNDKDVYFASLKKSITDEDEIKAASTVKVVTDIYDNALFFSRSVIPSRLKGESDVKVYRHVGIYGYTSDFLRKFSNMEQTGLEKGEGIEPLRAMENGYKIKVVETEYSSIGVDYPEHIKRVEEIIRKGME